jgi:hypothetical protein
MNYKGCFFYDGKRWPLEAFNVSIHQQPANISKKLYANNFGFERPEV